jgi:hypothetical protein
MADKPRTIEDAKDELSTAVVAKDWDGAARALAILHTIDDPERIRGIAAHHAQRRHGARRRAKLEAAQTIRAKLDQSANAQWPEGNTHRDGYVLGLDHAHGLVQAMSEDDVDDGD